VTIKKRGFGATEKVSNFEQSEKSPSLVKKVLQFPCFKTPIFYTNLLKEFFKLCQFVEFTAVSKRVKDVGSFAGLRPSPVESERCVRGKGLINLNKREMTRMLARCFW